MKKFIIKGTVVLSAIFGIVACKDFLEQPTPGNILATDFYKTEADVLKGVAGIYDQLQNMYNYSANWHTMYFLEELPSDDANAGGENAGNEAALQDINLFLTGPANVAIRDGWNALYSGIQRANQVIINADSTSAIGKRSIGEAKVLRAFFYFQLVTLWGDVPIVLGSLPQSEFLTTGRSPKTQVYQLIEDDLEDAAALLPGKAELTGNNAFRVSRETAYALKAKAHLFQGEYPEVLINSQKVIDAPGVGLEPRFVRLFSKTKEFGIESLFEVNFSNSDKTAEVNWAGINEGNVLTQLMGPRNEDFTPAKGDSMIGGWGFNTPTDLIDTAYDLAGDNSARKTSTVISKWEYEQLGKGGKIVMGRSQFEGNLRRKYGSYKTETDTVAGIAANYGTSFKLLRFADVLLMAAEAANRSGDDLTAQKYLNRVRNEREDVKLPNIELTGDDLFEAIVTERRLELAFEGQRFRDLVRWGRAENALKQYGFVAGKNEIYPIPENDRRTANLPQNPKY